MQRDRGGSEIRKLMSITGHKGNSADVCEKIPLYSVNPGEKYNRLGTYKITEELTKSAAIKG